MAVIGLNEDGTYAQDCPLCGQKLTDPVYATSHFMVDDTHRLYKYSDAAMHWDCYATWADRDEFVALYFESIRADAKDNEYWPVIGEAEGVLIRYGVAVKEASVTLRKSGTELRVPREDWSRWLAGGYVCTCAHQLEILAVEEALPFLNSIKMP